jgi:chromosome segregation ATPase
MSGFSVPQLPHDFMGRVYEPDAPSPCDNGQVGAAFSADHVAHAAELQDRDERIARDLELIAALADRAGVVRSRAAAVREGLARIPDELEAIAARRAAVESGAASARSELAAAEARLAALAGGRRTKPDEIDRARSEAATARQAVADAESELERLDGQVRELRSLQGGLLEEAAALPVEAARVAADLREAPRITESARAEPGADLDAIEEWGAQVRSALFVARGTLETERERIVVEANTLGTAVLGETLGGSSVAVIRRRVEERLG